MVTTLEQNTLMLVPDNVAHLSGAELTVALNRRAAEGRPCVVPGCGQQAANTAFVREAGRLAGRDWRKGDLIDLCAPHADDIYRAHYVDDPAQLAEWLKADAARAEQ